MTIQPLYNAKGEQALILKERSTIRSQAQAVTFLGQANALKEIDLEALFAGGHVGPNGYLTTWLTVPMEQQQTTNL